MNNNNNAAAAAVLNTLTAFEHSLIGFAPDLAAEFATGLRSCAQWSDVGEVLGFYSRVLAERVGALACYALPATNWRGDLYHVACDLSRDCLALTGPAPRPAQASLF